MKNDTPELDAYVRGNTVGIVEGLEMAALYHDDIADFNENYAVWDEDDGRPANGHALSVLEHTDHAKKIRAMKPRNVSAS